MINLKINYFDPIVAIQRYDVVGYDNFTFGSRFYFLVFINFNLNVVCSINGYGINVMRVSVSVEIIGTIHVSQVYSVDDIG